VLSLPAQDVLDGWEGFAPSQQRDLFGTVVMAAGQAAWGEVEERLAATLAFVRGEGAA
jgi:hypothetical protein